MTKAKTKQTETATLAEPKAQPKVEDLFKLLAGRKEALDLLEAQRKDIEGQFAERLEPFAGMVIKHPETGIISKVIKGQYGYGLRAMESQALRDARKQLGA